jgi:glycosyltransferase involved in cell wall biosynthesis
VTILVHDYLLVNRGAERSFAAICDLFPEAPIATLLYDHDVFGERLAGHTVTTSRLQRLGLGQSRFKALLPAFPPAIERLPVAGHDLVISSSSAFAHAVNVDETATHVCYCYTPFRYAWYERERGLAQAPAAARPALGAMLNGFRRWDRAKAQRATRYVAISRISQERILKYWGRHAEIVHPPVDVDRFASTEPEDFFLFVGELVRHKQVEVALAAAEEADVPIWIVGGGTDEERLRARYASRPGVRFLGRVPDEELDVHFARARALVVPNVEEFGITAVEAQAAGRPVLAANGGGARETVEDGVTGALFAEGDVRGLARMMRSRQVDEFEASDAIASASRFSVDSFRRRFLEQVDEAVGAGPVNGPTTADRPVRVVS